MNRARIVVARVAALASLVAIPTLARAADYHHVHVTASNATEAVRWYTRYMDCQALADRDDGVDCGGAQVVFDSRPTLGSSQRTGIDHISLLLRRPDDQDGRARASWCPGLGRQDAAVR